ncbi:MAG: hypothetical protein LBI29_00255 [Rickettsiales bacterium]|jgi:hypothetical protein|nr:hypothetical protein [Rickettsiales bacterium]
MSEVSWGLKLINILYTRCTSQMEFVDKLKIGEYPVIEKPQPNVMGDRE